MKRMQGFAIASAIFLIVILAALGAFMVSMSNTQQLTSAQDLQGSRAYRAARMGMEWAVTSLCNGVGCAAPMTACPAASTTMSAAPDGFTVVVTCSVQSFNEAGPGGDVPRYFFTLTSTATNTAAAGGPGKVERKFTAYVEFPSE